VKRFRAIQNELHFLDEQTGVTDFVNRWLRAEFTNAGELRVLVASLMLGAERPEELLSQIIEAVSQPEIPPDVTEVRIMSLHKSKSREHQPRNARRSLRSSVGSSMWELHR
jgi:DNA helicase-2/ATP-dependent DNA helicase PcrA